MQLGLNLPIMVPGLDRDRLLDWARRIDAGPFSSVAAGERIFFPNPEIMIALTVAAAVTERVALQTSVVVLPMHAELHVAKQVATLDMLSEGRVVLGVGVGGREEDYRAFGRPYDRRRLRRMQEQVAVMRAAWRGEETVEALRPLEPRCVQEGGPPVLVGAIDPRSIERAAAWADGISGFSFGPSSDETGLAWNTAREAWKAAGRDSAPRLVTSFWYALGAGARDQLDEVLRRYLAFMGPEMVDAIVPMVLVDSADKLRDAVRRMEDLGTDEVLLVPSTTDPDDVDRVADILGGMVEAGPAAQRNKS
jgi:alkanesulfonate monooxygenase SsuD/methylene tetrahydromethanopterin reductase-like flavin-dependent oxidoreductase (luciferase family)